MIESGRATGKLLPAAYILGSLIATFLPACTSTRTTQSSSKVGTVTASTRGLETATVSTARTETATSTPRPVSTTGVVLTSTTAFDELRTATTRLINTTTADYEMALKTCALVANSSGDDLGRQMAVIAKRGGFDTLPIESGLALAVEICPKKHRQELIIAGKVFHAMQTSNFVPVMTTSPRPVATIEPSVLGDASIQITLKKFGINTPENISKVKAAALQVCDMATKSDAETVAAALLVAADGQTTESIQVLGLGIARAETTCPEHAPKIRLVERLLGYEPG